MFCPPEYVSLAELWKEFFEKFRSPLTRIALEKYGNEAFALGDQFGSTDDFCEDAFLSTFLEVPVSVASPDGHIMRIETVLDGGRSKLFQKMSPLESFLAANDPDEAGPENYWLRKLGSDDFEPWDTSRQTITDWKSKYLISETALPSMVRFHTLPFIFERGRFVIPDQAPPWLSDVLDEHFLPDMAERFRGRSLCLDRQAAKAWRMKVLQKQAFLKDLEGSENVEPQRGRPPKIEKIKAAYRMRFPEGHKCSLEKVRQQVESHSGQEISLKTLQRAIREIKSEADKKPKI